MPFVMVERGPSSIDKNEIECHCKDVWVAMNLGGETNLKATDVGGVVVTRSSQSYPDVNVRFIYCDRGEQFRQDLLSQLKARFGCSVQPIPVEAESWFADPVWAVVTDADNEVELA